MTAFPEFAIPADVGQERVFPVSNSRRHCTYLSGYVVRPLSVQRANAKRSTWQRRGRLSVSARALRTRRWGFLTAQVIFRPPAENERLFVHLPKVQ